MIDDIYIRTQLTRLAVIHSQLNSARTFEAFAGVLEREHRLSSIDLSDGVDALMASNDDAKVTPGRVVDYAYRARATRLAHARKNREETTGPSSVPYGDTCGHCGTMLEILVSERAVWCPTCKTVRADRAGFDALRVFEVDSALIDGELRLAKEKRDARMAQVDLDRWRAAA